MGNRLMLAAGLVLGLAGMVRAQQAPFPITQPQLDTLNRLARVMALAPVCSLRPEDWTADLWRGAMQQASGTTARDDTGLRAATGGNIADSAIGSEQLEALEDFAEAPPEKTCGPLADSADLKEADRVVRAWRARQPQS